MIDLHCHILHGLDDGPADIDETVAMCRLAARDGITDIVATPHCLNGVHDVHVKERNIRITTLNAALRDTGLHLQIHPGAEVRLQPDLSSIVRSRPELCLNASRYVLVELPPVFPPRLRQELFQLQLTGLIPILAHVERYETVQRDPDWLLPIIKSGGLTQITTQSLTGDFGESCRICAEDLVSRNMAHILASDGHNVRRRRPLLSPAKQIITDISGLLTFELMAEKRPQAILHNAAVSIPDPIPSSRSAKPGLLARLGAML